jgi:hypothetical protein
VAPALLEAACSSNAWLVAPQGRRRSPLNPIKQWLRSQSTRALLPRPLRSLIKMPGALPQLACVGLRSRASRALFKGSPDQRGDVIALRRSSKPSLSLAAVLSVWSDSIFTSAAATARLHIEFSLPGRDLSTLRATNPQFCADLENALATISWPENYFEIAGIVFAVGFPPPAGRHTAEISMVCEGIKPTGR